MTTPFNSATPGGSGGTQRGSAQFDDAFALLSSYLNEWGLDGMDASTVEILIEGYSPEVAVLRLRETPEYKQRFKANDARIKAGLPALSPAEYIANEREYQSTLREYGLPQTFYDDRKDFENWLAADVSPQEIRDRAQTARAAYIDSSQGVRDQWQKLYGLSPGDAVAAFLDPDRALGALQRKAQAATISAEATSAFRDPYQLTTQRAEQLADAGVNQAQAQAGFRDVASRLQRDQMLGRMAGENFTQTEAENEVLLNDASAAAERDKIYAAEQGRFQQNYLPTTSAGLARGGGNF